MVPKKVIVVGAGAAGLMAAGEAASAGATTLLLEKMKRPGLKLAITGKGRCNLTNIAEIPEFIGHFGKSGKFLRQAFSRFFNGELMAFFEGLGLRLVRERGGRVFPAGGKAPEVVAALRGWVDDCGVELRSASGVDALLMEQGRIVGVLVRGRRIACDAVILATGGASYPKTGSTGDGYALAMSAGHSVVPLRPALVPLITAGDAPGRMDALGLRNIGVRLLVNGKKHRDAFGELVFTPFGVTGPVILTLSGDAVDALEAKSKVELLLDLKPALDPAQLDSRLLRDLEARGKERIGSILRGLLPALMIPVCLELTGIAEDRLGTNLSAPERKRLRLWLKEFRLEVTGHRPMAEAIVTAGGIDTKEVDPRTMESRLTPGLYLTGELLDLQAHTGGYNLQAAFSTGWLAGRSAAYRKPEGG